jgi:hypothetical protein
MPDPSKLETDLIDQAKFARKRGEETSARLMEQAADRLAGLRRSLDSLIDDDCDCDEYRGLLSQLMGEAKPDAD